jgi:hypothetical protein
MNLKSIMVKFNHALFFAGVIALSSCSFSTGTNKDFATGLSYSYNGFAVEEVLLVGPDNTAMSDNKISLNTQIAIVVQGLSNYELKDEKAFPGLMLVLTDSKGAPVINETDLFADSQGYSPADAAVLRGSVTVGEPMKSGDTYHLKMRVWDKNKPENELTAEVDLVVK